MRPKALTFAVAFLLVGLAVGERVPDLDQHTSLLVHRSVFTHGPLLSLLLFWMASGAKPTWMRMLALGFCIGTAVHLGFDLFPRAWSGFALIHIPGIGWTYPVVSWMWISMAMVWCVYLAMRLVRNGLQGVALAVSTVAVFGYAGMEEDGTFGPLVATVAATAAGLVAVAWRASRADSKAGDASA